MAKIKFGLTYLNPQPTLTTAGTPVPLSSGSIEARYIYIEAPETNAGNVYIGDTQANIVAGNCTTLGPGEAFYIGAEDSGADEDQVFVDVSELLFDGVNNGDKVVVSYLMPTEVRYNG